MTVIRGVIAMLACGAIGASAWALVVEGESGAWRVGDGGEAVYAGEGEAALALDKPAVLRGGLRLTLDTDAAAVVMTSGEARVRIALPDGDEHTLTLANSAGRHAVAVNGEEQPGLRLGWLMVFVDGSDALGMSLEDASFARATLGPWADAAGATDADADADSDADADADDVAGDELPPLPPLPPLGASDGSTEVVGAGESAGGTPLSRVREAVFQVRALVRGGRATSSGTGFVVTPDGFVVTSLHVVQGSQSAQAIFADAEDEPVALELWAAEPRLDLALLRLDPGARDTDESPWPMVELYTDRPEPGEDVWAIGYPRGLGYTVTRGIVNGVRDHQRLPAELRRALNMRDDSVWVQTDATINRGNSGGPLVNDRGEAVGVSTWRWEEGANLYFALHAAHVRELLDGRPDRPAGFRASGAPDPRTRAPRPATTGPDGQRADSGPATLDLERNRSAAQLIQAAGVLDDTARCRHCQGEGEITRRVRSGERVEGVFRVPVYRDRTETCPTCEGNGYRDGAVTAAHGGRLADTWARLRSDDRDADRAIGQVVARLRRLMEVNPRTLGPTINPEAMRLINRGPAVGEPIFAVGRVFRSTTAPGGGVMVRVENESLVFVDPVLVDHDGSGTVVVGGLLAGTSGGERGPRAHYVRHGFIVGR